MPEARRETVHRMTRRCDGWDYRQRAIYQVTLVQADRARSLLGRLVIDDPKAPPEARALEAAGRLHARDQTAFLPADARSSARDS